MIIPLFSLIPGHVCLFSVVIRSRTQPTDFDCKYGATQMDTRSGVFAVAVNGQSDWTRVLGNVSLQNSVDTRSGLPVGYLCLVSDNVF